ncbi:MAG: hypothetical protein ACFFAT_07350 [Promethearchaeota archaeon]
MSPKIISFLNEIRFELFIELINSSSNGKFPLIYLVPSEIIEIINKIQFENNIKSSGLYFGMIKKGDFYISLEAVEFLDSFDCFPDKSKVQVNNEGEKSILYGNQILKKDILKISPKLTKDEFLLIFNESNEIIAIAKSKVNYLESKQLEPNGIIALNLVDKGYYLRRQS